MDKIVFLGGNGFALELYEYMLHDGIEVAGYYAPAPDTMSRFMPYLGDERNDFDKDALYVVASGLIPLRRRMISFINDNSLTPYSFVSSKAYVSSIASIGRGAAIVPNTVISGDPVIGDFVMMNAFSMIAHQCSIGSNVVLSPGAKITGSCKIGDDVLFGSNTALIPGTRVETGAEIGIGAVPKRIVRSNRFVKAPTSDVVDMALLKAEIM